MNLQEFIQKKIHSVNGTTISEIDKPKEITFLTNDEAEKRGMLEAYKVWYCGDGNKLLDYYTGEEISGFLKEPIYNRNKTQYFWGLSSKECDIKRVHSGVPHVIIDTLTNVIGKPQIDLQAKEQWDEVERFNDLLTKMVQKSRPMTLVQGYGAWKPNFNKSEFALPTWEYYDAENVDYIYKSGVLIGIIFKSYYKDMHDVKYVLVESRYTKDNNSYIDYSLFRFNNDTNVDEVPLDFLPDTAKLQPHVIEGLNKFLAVPSCYFYDYGTNAYGRSLYAGKLDIFDMLDEALSQAQLALRQSGTIVTVGVDAIGRGANGQTGLPKIWNKTFIDIPSVPNGDGTTGTKPFDVIQPNVDFERFMQVAQHDLDYILTGVLSPATLGIDIAKKDNAEAQREKEKVTIMTRNNVIAKETIEWQDIVNMSLMISEYMNTGEISITDYNVSVTYDEFANPTFENVVQTLAPIWVQGAIPTEEYATIVWGDKKSDEELQKIIQWLDENKAKDDVNLGDLYGEATDPVGTPSGLVEEDIIPEEE